MGVCVRESVSVCVFAHVRVRAHTYTLAHVHTYGTHVHIHAHNDLSTLCPVVPTHLEAIQVGRGEAQQRAPAHGGPCCTPQQVPLCARACEWRTEANAFEFESMGEGGIHSAPGGSERGPSPSASLKGSHKECSRKRS